MSYVYPTKTEFARRIKNKSEVNSEWSLLIEERIKKSSQLPLLTSNDDQGFFYVHLDEISDLVSQIEKLAKMDIYIHFSKRISMSSVQINESYYSSKIEGAFSTRRQAKEVITRGKANNNSEQMILNNFYALEFVTSHLGEPIDKNNFIQLQKIITKDTLNPEDITDEYRTNKVFVVDSISNDTVYIAPDYRNVEAMMESLFNFIENSTLNPLITASILHFYIGYIHPFFDGNGRITRSTMYWYLLNKGYDIFRFFSISEKYDFDKNRYYQAFLDTEESWDVTYFVLMNLETVLKGISDTLRKLEKYHLRFEIENKIKSNKLKLNKIQKKVISQAINSDGRFILSNKKQNWWSSKEEAQSDLKELVNTGLLKIIEDEKKYELNAGIETTVDTVIETTNISIEFIEQTLFELMLDDVPPGLDRLSTHTFVESVSDVEIRTVDVINDTVQLHGIGFVNVELQYGSDGDLRRDLGSTYEDSFFFSFTLGLEDKTVIDYEIDVDTESFYE